MKYLFHWQFKNYYDIKKEIQSRENVECGDINLFYTKRIT